MRSYTLGNGSLLVGVDARAQMRDLYFPYIGRENHVSGRTHRIGVFVDGAMHWTESDSWQMTTTMMHDTMVGTAEGVLSGKGVRLSVRDAVYNEQNIFLREIVVTNDAKNARDIGLFFGHEFQVGETARGDTAYYDPRMHALVHYEGRRMFLMRAESHESAPFDQWSVGLSGIEGKEGTFRDADDGVLSQNGIEHGQVDSVMRLQAHYQPGESRTFYYWLCAGETFEAIQDLNEYVRTKTPQYLLGTVSDYWRAWLTRQGINLSKIPTGIQEMFTRSLLVIRAHTDKRGGIIAASDTGILNQGRDTYAYVWPRDAAYAIRALILAGDFESARNFFEFCDSIVAKEGYFMHKYLADGSVGSSWHPWYRNGATELPVQADETAIILVVLKEYYHVTRDLEFVERVFNSLIKRCADFLVAHVDHETGLPKPSYDLWEEVYCVSTYTASTTYGALRVGEYFADLLGKHQLAEGYRNAAERMRDAITSLLWSDAKQAFVKAVFRSRPGEFTYDYTLDFSSSYGVYEFGVVPKDDSHLAMSFETMSRELELKEGTIRGMPRNQGDMYYRTSKDAAPNPWTVTTLWKAQYLLSRVKTADDLAQITGLLEWVVERATDSGMLSEQVNPYTGEALSVTPLVWSHAEFVTTVVEYIQKMDDLGLCAACYPLRRR